MLKSTFATTRRALFPVVMTGMVMAGVMAGTVAATNFSAMAGPRDTMQGVYAYHGNEFIIRERGNGRTLYLTLYRRAGDQWEEHSTRTTTRAELRDAVRNGAGNSNIEKIYANGRYLGPINIDLDNPLNTSLNRGGNGPKF